MPRKPTTLNFHKERKTEIRRIVSYVLWIYFWRNGSIFSFFAKTDTKRFTNIIYYVNTCYNTENISINLSKYFPWNHSNFNHVFFLSYVIIHQKSVRFWGDLFVLSPYIEMYYCTPKPKSPWTCILLELRVTTIICFAQFWFFHIV